MLTILFWSPGDSLCHSNLYQFAGPSCTRIHNWNPKRMHLLTGGRDLDEGWSSAEWSLGKGILFIAICLKFNGLPDRKVESFLMWNELPKTQRRFVNRVHRKYFKEYIPGHVRQGLCTRLQYSKRLKIYISL